MSGDKYRLLQNIMQGKIAGRRTPGQRKTSWLKNLRDWYGVSSNSLFRLAFDKLKIAMMVTNVLKGHSIWEEEKIILIASRIELQHAGRGSQKIFYFEKSITQIHKIWQFI